MILRSTRRVKIRLWTYLPGSEGIFASFFFNFLNFLNSSLNYVFLFRRLNVLESAGAQSLVCAVLRTICNLVMIDSFEHCTPFINLVGESVDRFRTARFVTLGFICSYSYLESLWIRKQSTNEESNRFTEAHDGPGAVLKKTLECWSLLPVEDAFCTEVLTTNSFKSRGLVTTYFFL